jgi:Zn-dependent M16 (insulinase) family peptidase
MGLREVKSRLNTLDKTEIIKLISEMYKKIPSAKNYLDIYATGDIKELTEKYKKEIEKYIYPSGSNLVLKESEARKLIRTVRKMKVVELNIELELHYVACCLDVIADFGYWDENYYLSIDRMYNSAVAGIGELGLEDEYADRLENLFLKGSEFGLELYY